MQPNRMESRVWKRTMATVAVGLGIASTVVAPGAAPAAENPFQRGPDPSRDSVAASRGTFATAQVSVAAGNGFGGGAMYAALQRPSLKAAVGLAPFSPSQNLNNAAGAYAQFTVNASAAGTATLQIRFANGTTTARPASLIVNGSTVQTPSFEGTGAWTTWVTKTLTVSLNAGSNTIRLNPTTANGLPNIDYLEIPTP